MRNASDPSDLDSAVEVGLRVNGWDGRVGRFTRLIGAWPGNIIVPGTIPFPGFA